jgi:hypothetical protein
MQQDGVVQCKGVISNDGRLLVVVEWPDGQMRLFDRDEAVGLSLMMLNAASALFPNATEFGRTLDLARYGLFDLQPAPLSKQ